jgi:uncharacterized protein (UPF0335 family)
MTLDNDTIRTWLQFLAVLVMPICSMVYTWVATRDKDNSQHIKAVEAALGNHIASHAARIDRIEAELKHLPNKDDISGIKADLKGMQADQAALHRDVHAMRNTTSRIEDFLLKK